MQLSFTNQTLIFGNLGSSTALATAVTGYVLGMAELASVVGDTKLSNKKLYPNFSRCSPSVALQAETFRDVILFYGKGRPGWTDIALLSTSDDIGLDLSESFIDVIQGSPLKVISYRQFGLSSIDSLGE